jgi:hypothetical protein
VSDEGKTADTGALDRAHLLLLSKFLLPADPARFGGQQWCEVLGEPAGNAIERYARTGLIRDATLSEKLEHSFTAADLRLALRQAGLPVGGRKAGLARRLADENPAEAASKAAGITTLCCTERGRTLAERAVAEVRKARQIAEDAVVGALIRRNFRGAANAVVQFERKQVFPRGLNVQWNAAEADRLTAEVQQLYRTYPNILRGIPEDVLEAIRPAAARMLLWGENRLREKVETGARFDGDVAARMLVFSVWTQRNLREMRASGVMKVEMLATEDSCPKCKKLGGRKYRLAEAPELPNPDCTHEMGCRCCYVACT